MFSVEYTDYDREIWEAELESFVPDKLFDVHCHLWDEAHAGSNTEVDSCLRYNTDGKVMFDWSRQIYPNRKLGFYFLGTPLLGMDVAKHNEFLLQESTTHALPAAMIVTPQVTADQIAALLERGIAGLKPYRVFSNDPAECSIADYLPEYQMEVANAYGKAITLHLSKRHGIAAPENMRDLAIYVKKYPKVKWILAHCARAFNSFTLEGQIHRLAELGDNVWCDTSAVCDPYSHFLLMKYFNIRRILFGSDNIGAGSDRGSYITWGRAWAFFPGSPCPHCDGRATFVIYEQLRAMKKAADMAGLSKADLEAIFSGNAHDLFGAALFS